MSLQQDSNDNSVRVVNCVSSQCESTEGSNDNSVRVVNCVTSECESTAGQ